MKAPTTQARPKSRPPRRRGGARAGLRSGPLAVGLVLLASPALGQAPAPPPDPARLDYARPKTLTACPEEFYFRAFVRGRFGGVDPFTADAPTRIKVTLVPPSSGVFVAKVEMYNQAEDLVGRQKPDLRGTDCTTLVRHAGSVVVSWLGPVDGPAPVPAVAPPRRNRNRLRCLHRRPYSRRSHRPKNRGRLRPLLSR